MPQYATEPEARLAAIKKLLPWAGGGMAGLAGGFVPLNKTAGMAMEKQALSPVTMMALKQLLMSTGTGGAVGGVGGGLYGAFRGKRPGESRLGAIGRSALSGAGWGAGLAGGTSAGLMASKAGRGLLAALRGRSRMLKGLAGKFGGYLNIPRDIVVDRSFEPVSRAMGELALNPLGVALPAATGAAGMLGLGGMMSRATEPEEPYAKRAYHKGRASMNKSRAYQEGQMNKQRAYLAGRYVGLAKQSRLGEDWIPEASALGLGGLGALAGGMTTKKDEKTGRRDKLRMLLRTIIGGGIGFAAGGMLPGVVGEFVKERHPKLKDVTENMGRTLRMAGGGVAADIGTIGHALKQLGRKGAEGLGAIGTSMRGAAGTGSEALSALIRELRSGTPDSVYRGLLTPR